MNQKVRELAATVADPNARQWVNWRMEERTDKKTGEKVLTKVPYTPNGRKAKSTVASTWSTYDDVDAAQGQFNGVGIILTGGLLGADLDHVFEPGHETPPYALEFIEKANSYTEYSPSHTGVHVILRVSGTLKLKANSKSIAKYHKKEKYECYTEGRYFTFTGDVYGEQKPVRTVTPEEAEELLKILGYPWRKESKAKRKAQSSDKALSLTDQELLDRMFKAMNGAKVRSLYNGDTSTYGGDDSAADAALCLHLAFWTGKNAAQMERMWLASPLGAREKTQGRADYLKRTVENAIAKCSEVYSPRSGDDKPDRETTQATQLVQHVTNNQDIVLFLDDYKVAHVRLPVGDHFEVWPCGGTDFTDWLFDEYYRITSKAVGTNAISAALNTIRGRARAGGIKHRLHNRIAEHDGAIWYDLCDEKWRAIRIDQKGWSIVDTPPILFARRTYQKPQVDPFSGGDVREILDFVNVKEPNQRILLVVLIVASFIPGFPHPILYVHGSQGSAKSSLLEVLLALVDPSTLGVLSYSKNPDELKQALYHHSAFLCLDNVSGIDGESADILCRATTGTGFTKRKLYTDLDAVIYRIQANIAINGINLGSSRADLLERCILFELERIPDSERKQFVDVLQSFEKVRPRIFGAILDAVSKALAIKPTVRTDGLFRMADFTMWGCAIAKAVGYTQESFLDAFHTNINEQVDEVIESNFIASLVVELMCDGSIVEWTGTPTRLLEEITAIAFGRIGPQTSGAETVYERRKVEEKLPENPNALMRAMRHITPVLAQRGIEWDRDKTRKERTVIIRRKDGHSGTNTPF